jgi:hypothetical protein
MIPPKPGQGYLAYKPKALHHTLKALPTVVGQRLRILQS